MLLYFENSRGYRTLISNPTTVKDMWKDIKLFLENHNFKSYYTRVNFGEKEWEIDFGSHTEFFIVTDFDDEDFAEFTKGDNRDAAISGKGL